MEKAQYNLRRFSLLGLERSNRSYYKGANTNTLMALSESEKKSQKKYREKKKAEFLSKGMSYDAHLNRKRKKYFQEYLKRNHEKITKYHQNYIFEKKKFVYTKYCKGTPNCACCGETEIQFLTIDHLNNDGAKHRKEINHRRIILWLIEKNFPEGYQVLCWNCNSGRHYNGGICPHKDHYQKEIIK